MARFAILTSATGGGAGIAAKRVYTAIQESLSSEHTIKLIDMPALGEAVFSDVANHNGGSNKQFSDTHYTVEYPGYARSFIVSYLRGFDVLNIHWSSYLVTLTEIKLLTELGVKVVFTCHDFYYLFGGCHYPHTCINWLMGCVKCPQVDLSRFPLYSPENNLRLKQAIFSSPNVKLTAPSAHLVNIARHSNLVTVDNSYVIRNPVDKSSFTLDEKRPRGLLSPNKYRLLLIADSSHERRKGFDIATEALVHLQKLICDTQLEVTLVGHGSTESAALLQNNNVTAISKGHLKDPSEIALAYQNVDAIVTASLEDNWPNILVEAYACGALAIVGPGHGCAEFVTRYNSGVVSESYSPSAFAKAAADLFVSMAQGQSIRSSIAEELFSADHSNKTIAKSFLNVYLS